MVSVHDAHNGGDIIMNTIAWIALILAAAAIATSVASNRRQRRLAKRIRRLEQRTDNQREQLLAPLRAITAANIEQQLAARGRTPRLPIQCRSEFGEDLILAHLFENQPEGYYIEVGAYDGQTNAVSWIFDAIGWKGLLVEAIPERAEQARIARPNAAVIHAALSHKEQLRQQSQQQNQQASPPTIELTIYPSALDSNSARTSQQSQTNSNAQQHAIQHQPNPNPDASASRSPHSQTYSKTPPSAHQPIDQSSTSRS